MTNMAAPNTTPARPLSTLEPGAPAPGLTRFWSSVYMPEWTVVVGKNLCEVRRAWTEAGLVIGALLVVLAAALVAAFVEPPAADVFGLEAALV